MPADSGAPAAADSGRNSARVEQPEAGTRDFYVQEGQSVYSPLVSVHDEAADAQYWYLFDALGSTMGLVDANGNLSGKLQYDAFGNVLAEENVPRSAFFKYVGAYQYMPEEFEDMMLLWHRWYDPTVGRFVGRDAEEDGGPGLYSYPDAGSAPVSNADPSGLFSWDDFRDAWQDYYINEPLQYQSEPGFNSGRCIDCCEANSSLVRRMKGWELLLLYDAPFIPLYKATAKLLAPALKYTRSFAKGNVTIAYQVWRWRRATRPYPVTIDDLGQRAYMAARLGLPNPRPRWYDRPMGDLLGKGADPVEFFGVAGFWGIGGWEIGTWLRCLSRCL